MANTDWIEKSGIPYRYQAETFKTFKRSWQPKAYKSCLAYAEEFDLDKIHEVPTLIILSPKIWGNGKTHLACAIAHKIFERYDGKIEYCILRFASEPDMFRRIRDTYGGGYVKEYDIIRPLSTTRLLILDDIGKEEVKDPTFVQRTLFTIIDARYNYKIPTVMTSNLSIDRLKSYLGGNRENEASFNRLAETAQFLFMEGDSYRLRGDR